MPWYCNLYRLHYIEPALTKTRPWRENLGKKRCAALHGNKQTREPVGIYEAAGRLIEVGSIP